MNTQTLSPEALSVINQYLHFQFGSAVCSVPYYNNKVRGARGGLRAYTGKGSPKDIFDEIETVILKNRLDPKTLSDDSLKKLLADSNIGIDCSGLAYHILKTESQSRNLPSLNGKISFINAKGIFGKIRTFINPAGNCDVSTLADETNSKMVHLKDARPGDFITMISSNKDKERNHILIIHQVDNIDSITTKIHYTHAVAYPEDGIYGTGIKQGSVEITNLDAPITEQRWLENGFEGPANKIFIRANGSKTELRRLAWF